MLSSSRPPSTDCSASIDCGGTLSASVEGLPTAPGKGSLLHRLPLFFCRPRARTETWTLCTTNRRAVIGPRTGGSAQCPRRTLFRQWAQIAAMSDVTLGAMPPSPNGRHRAWRERFRRWWPGDSENVAHCGGLAPPFEEASPRKGVALRHGSRRLMTGEKRYFSPTTETMILRLTSGCSDTETS